MYSNLHEVGPYRRHQKPEVAALEGMQVMITVPSHGWISSIHGLQLSNKNKHVWKWLGQTGLCILLLQMS